MIFAQGSAADAVFYIQKGKVRLTVLSKSGKEATLGILEDGGFFGEGVLAGQPLRIWSAVAMTDCELMQNQRTGIYLQRRVFDFPFPFRRTKTEADSGFKYDFRPEAASNTRRSHFPDVRFPAYIILASAQPACYDRPIALLAWKR